VVFWGQTLVYLARQIQAEEAEALVQGRAVVLAAMAVQALSSFATPAQFNISLVAQ
jgi:plasmid maintenance system antidote protein VapI